MTPDYRALCIELMNAIDSGISVERIKQSPLAVRVDAALAQPEQVGLTEPTQKSLAWALCRVMDGMKQHEIHEYTGLPEDECEKIWAVFCQALDLEMSSWRGRRSNHE